MESPCTYFPTVLSYTTYMPVYGPFLEEMGDSFGVDNYSVLYNGPYTMTEFEPQNQRILEKNESYWDKDNVFIDELQFLYNTSASQIAPESFLRGEVDYATLDSSLLSAWLEDPERQNMVSSSRGLTIRSSRTTGCWPSTTKTSASRSATALTGSMR